MNRRTFLSALGVTIPASAIADKVSGEPNKYRIGHLTVERHMRFRDKGIYLLVFFNGKDVTDGCKEADDIDGTVTLYKRDEQGQFYVDESGEEVAQERLKGDVRFIRLSKEEWFSGGRK